MIECKRCKCSCDLFDEDTNKKFDEFKSFLYINYLADCMIEKKEPEYGFNLVEFAREHPDQLKKDLQQYFPAWKDKILNTFGIKND